MIMSSIGTLERYAELFRKELSEHDPLQQVVLKGHLVIEAALDNIIATVFFHPEYVFRARIGFAQKVALARAYGLRKADNSMWNLILSINEARNEVAHNLAGERRSNKLEQLRRIFMSEVTDEMQEKFMGDGIDVDKADDQTIVALACFLCAGFLGSYEDDVATLRRFIDTLDHGINPERERVPVNTPQEAKAKPKKTKSSGGT
ncbi:hypothetical protein [Sinorhizobium medicae]|uniref:hypothetical protein n=1 Tax=Sinorhizobium medicae TaxID=110321 RepID=UPI000FDBDA98|nr:hypothetical protein [Sinorhizobium medicae]MDX0753945.1 hypothetical protein [Sinorhizobium medicae]MDX0760133.1 hypothetical protein [Sinorhizobium medicae]MDX0796862.1 hypothetical protein [Sinorhizobium medicae]RVO71169.1 hypothetical protein CN084_29560 [Sinorhizobium medicae]